MRTIHSLDDIALEQDVILTVGTFDGVHLGHQHLLRQLIDQARDGHRLGAALSFSPHPRAILQPDRELTYLSTPDERSSLMRSLGLDLLVLLPFNKTLAATPAETFVRALHERLRMRELWVGDDFAMGRGREGDIAALQAIAPRIGFALRTIKPLHVDGEPVSSTRIRNLLSEGHVDQAARLLGRHYAISAQVVPGAQRGRTLGFRTANLAVPPRRAMPLDSVYAVWVTVDGRRCAGVANVGIRPTFDAGERLLEVHLLDFDGDLYGRAAHVAFVRRLRPERRFHDGAALAEQIRHDIHATRSLLGQQGVTDSQPG